MASVTVASATIAISQHVSASYSPSSRSQCLAPVKVSSCLTGLPVRSSLGGRVQKLATVTAPAFNRRSTPRRLVTKAASTTAVDTAALNAKFGIDGSVTVDAGEGGLPRVVLTHRSGSSAEIYLYGACVTSWKVPGKGDLLYVRPDAVFTGAKPISGGVPHCFPQFGPGEIQQHGFARNLSWEIASSSADVNPDDPDPSVEFVLTEGEYTKGIWDYSFKAIYVVTLQKDKLRLNLRVINNDSKPFNFTGALHTYFAADIAGVKVKGLKGLKVLDKVNNGAESVEEREVVTISSATDTVYADAPLELVLDNGKGAQISIQNSGAWKDAVVWNPDSAMPACYKEFVCVENAQVFNPVTVAAGASWDSEVVLAA